MTAKAFIDTDVLLYAGSQYPGDQEKRVMALELLGRSDLELGCATHYPTSPFGRFRSHSFRDGREGKFLPAFTRTYATELFLHRQ